MEGNTPIFKKRKFNKLNRVRRQQQTCDNSSSSEDEIQVVQKKKRALAPNPMFQTTKRHKENESVQLNSEKSSSDESEIQPSYKSSKTAEPSVPVDQGATATLEIETAFDRDAQSIYQKSLEVNKDLKGKADDKVYRGLANYTQFYEKKDTALGNASSGMVRQGPIRAPTNLRSTVRWDYQPDICKDYKETGFCGFGDSCKFLHDRSDYKHGWQLEQEDQNKDESGSENYEIESDDDKLPFKCFICRNSFVNPIVTKCKHYFCEKCALDNYKKSTRCFICNAQTNGVFNPAKEIIEKMKHLEDHEGSAEEPDSD